MNWLSRGLAALSVCCLGTWAAVVTTTQHAEGYWQSRSQVVIASTGCAQATTFVARLTSPSGSDITNMTNLICGLVTDGLIDGDLSTTGCGTYFDTLWIPAQGSATNAALNICGTSFTLTPTGGPTFTAYQGWTSVQASATVYIETSFNPTSGTPKFTQNANHLSAWVNNNVSSSGTAGWIMGLSRSSATENYSVIVPRYSDNNFYGSTTAASTGYVTNALSNSSGFFICVRTAASGAGAIECYRNGSSLGSATTASSTQSSGTFVLNGSKNQGSGAVFGGCNGCIASAFSIGALLNGTQRSNFQSRLSTYRTAVGL